jgi:hypothetical protein
VLSPGFSLLWTRQIGEYQIMNRTKLNGDESGNATLDSIFIIVIAMTTSVIVISLTGYPFPNVSADNSSPLNVLLSILLATVAIILCIKFIHGTRAQRSEHHQS